MNKFVKKGIKSLNGIKRDAIIYSKNTYNDFAKPMVKTISKKIAKIDFNGIYKESMTMADGAVSEVRSLARKSKKLIKVSSDKIIRTSIVKFKKAEKFINKRMPLAKAAVFGFAAVNFTKAEIYLNKTYPKVEKFVKANYPNVRNWVTVQLPKVEAFLAGQLSARMQKFAA
jgi:hypothetical protein